MTAADRALAAIDAGLQTSAEHGYGTDHWPDQCARCQQHPPVADGSLCAGCRTYLLGDTDTDPRATWVPRPGTMEADAAELQRAVRELATALAAAMAPIIEAFQRVAEALASAGHSVADLLHQAEQIGQPEATPQLCPRGHGPTKGGLCRRCARPGNWRLP